MSIAMFSSIYYSYSCHHYVLYYNICAQRIPLWNKTMCRAILCVTLTSKRISGACAIYILQRGVQWKQGVVIYTMSCTILLYARTRCSATAPASRWSSGGRVGFHNFNLRIFNLRVSNPNKFIVDVFLTRCRISMCQGLGPTKHEEISEIDRTTCPLV